jgi:hypothetical protein
VYVHDALTHIVTDMECVSDGNFERGIVLKVRNSKWGRNEFVAVIYSLVLGMVRSTGECLCATNAGC